jgi:hypothetical protein
VHSQAKGATKAEKQRFQYITELGCIACRQLGLTRHAEVHHIVEGNKRLGHSFTIGLCPWHHRSVIEMGSCMAEWIYGPALGGDHANKRAFYKIFGSERELLEKQNELLRVQRPRLEAAPA